MPSLIRKLISHTIASTAMGISVTLIRATRDKEKEEFLDVIANGFISSAIGIFLTQLILFGFNFPAVSLIVTTYLSFLVPCLIGYIADIDSLIIVIGSAVGGLIYGTIGILIKKLF